MRGKKPDQVVLTFILLHPQPSRVAKPGCAIAGVFLEQRACGLHFFLRARFPSPVDQLRFIENPGYGHVSNAI